MTLACDDLTVRFDDVAALAGLDITVPEGSIMAVMGPSGCGKSTLLRVVAGLQRADSGTVRWRDEDITDVPTHLRGFGLMFQDYALFPHRSVAENVGFGLRMNGWDRDDIAGRVGDMLDIVGLAGYGSRAVDELSGGEQQRVALARTLAPRPRLVSLDEPLGSLDRTLRDRLVAEMRDTFTQLGVTVLYVTHDQDEAFTIGERIAIMRSGVIVAEGTAGELWAHPGTGFVARLVGHDNVLSAEEATRAGIPTTDAAGVVVTADALTVTADPKGPATVTAVGLRGGWPRTEVVVSGVRLVSTRPSTATVGQAVRFTIDREAVIALPGG